MKSYKEYLQEKYLTSGNYREQTFEFFINPSDKEVKELGNDLRAFIDIDKKDIIVFNGYLLHEDAIKILHQNNILKDFDYESYWKTGKDSDRYISITMEPNNYYSDSLSDMLFRIKKKDNEEEIKNGVKKLVNNNFSWIRGKWFDHVAFQVGLDEIREML